ncbi:HSP90 family protein [Gordonia neofelifaecis]|uniref:HSP90 family protein n=1 Tax=Gordonia neofelifaecis NRRL B-59395 TaxID=644548 RepID=F1YKI3_9ACTN|nr:HSP90 family protein [Gordonia neofelifaecis]EGD54869.1 HSP90 family protein [Gordonia neofelifaecis NRRL B-59395]
MEQRGVFDVDLRGLIDVLGNNLYTNPGVFVRELLQNAIDAQTVRGTAETTVEVTADGTEFTISDSGVGMHSGQIAELLGTIGRSSKRDELGFSEQATIGQFGVGLLSGFLAGDRIEVSSKADGHDPVHWIGDAGGTVETGPGDRREIGTTVRIVARPGFERWLDAERVAALAARYTAVHPTPVAVNGRRVNPPAELFADDTGRRVAAQVAYCQDELGFTPLDTFQVEVPEAGLRGVAFVRPSGGDLVARAEHRVYVKSLLVGDLAELLPEWAYFVRIVVDSTELTPTASRESVVRDDLFQSVVESLGDQVLTWLAGLEQRPATRAKFLNVHEQGIKALAAHRPELLGFVDRHCVFETNYGPMPLATFRARFGDLRYTGSVDDFRVLGDILGGRGYGLVNAGYAFETGVIRALMAADPGIAGEYVTQEVLLTALGDVPDSERTRFAAALALATTALAPYGCDVDLTAIEPGELSGLLLTDDSAKLAGDRREMLSEVAGDADAWLAAVAAVDAQDQQVPSRPVLVLNVTNTLVGRLPSITDPTIAGALVRTVYSQALVRAHRSLSADAARDVDAAIMLLADLATRTGDR